MTKDERKSLAGMGTGITVPRLKPGYGYRGPDWYGCCNTGTAPTIRRSLWGPYVVGPELDVDDVCRQLRMGMHRRCRVVRLHPDNPRCVVRIYRTRIAAVREFLDRCREQLKINAEEAEAHRKAAQDARSRDPETAARGALALVDYM